MNYWHIQLHPGELHEWTANDIMHILKQGFIGCSGDPKYDFNKLKVGDVVLARHGGAVLALAQVKKPTSAKDIQGPRYSRQEGYR